MSTHRRHHHRISRPGHARNQGRAMPRLRGLAFEPLEQRGMLAAILGEPPVACEVEAPAVIDVSAADVEWLIDDSATIELLTLDSDTPAAEDQVLSLPEGVSLTVVNPWDNCLSDADILIASPSDDRADNEFAENEVSVGDREMRRCGTDLLYQSMVTRILAEYREFVAQNPTWPEEHGAGGIQPMVLTPSRYHPGVWLGTPGEALSFDAWLHEIRGFPIRPIFGGSPDAPPPEAIEDHPPQDGDAIIDESLTGGDDPAWGWVGIPESGGDDFGNCWVDVSWCSLPPAYDGSDLQPGDDLLPVDEQFVDGGLPEDWGWYVDDLPATGGEDPVWGWCGIPEGGCDDFGNCWVDVSWCFPPPTYDGSDLAPVDDVPPGDDLPPVDEQFVDGGLPEDLGWSDAPDDGETFYFPEGWSFVLSNPDWDPSWSTPQVSDAEGDVSEGDDGASIDPVRCGTVYLPEGGWPKPWIHTLATPTFQLNGPLVAVCDFAPIAVATVGPTLTLATDSPSASELPDTTSELAAAATTSSEASDRVSLATNSGLSYRDAAWASLFSNHATAESTNATPSAARRRGR